MPYMQKTDVMTKEQEELAEIERLSPKAQGFVHELLALCVKHGVQIAVSGYDSLQVCDDGGPIIFSNGLVDKTGSKASGR